MATRVETREYMLPIIAASIGTSSTAGAYNDSGDLTVYIPETASRTIIGATLHVIDYNNNYVNNVHHGGWGVRCSCNAGVNWTNVTTTANLNESDENFSFQMTADVTAEFTARFGAGATGTARWGYYHRASTTPGIQSFSNATCKLIVTFSYDDTGVTTRSKTVRIPIESLNDRLTTTAAEVRQGTVTNQLPQLTGGGGLLPENTPVLRQVFLELYANTLPAATTNTTMTLRIDGAGSTQTTAITNTLDSASAMRFMWDLTGETWTAAHGLFAFHTGGSNCVGHLGGWMTVTYEYNHGATTRFLNSLLMGFGEDADNAMVVADKSTVSIERYIEEPGTITLRQSGVWLKANKSNTNATFSLGIGGQTVTGYTPTADGQISGMLSIVQRIDAGAFRGAGITLARGPNTFTAQWYHASNNNIGNISTMMILNYESDLAAAGSGVHAQSRYYNQLDSNNTFTTFQTVTPTPPAIPEANYWLMSVMPIIYEVGIGATIKTVLLEAERTAGEGDGWVTLFVSMSVGVAENGFWIDNAVARSQFKRWPLDTDGSRMDIEASRMWKLRRSGNRQNGMGLWLTWHAHTWTLSGTVSDYEDADGAGLTVRFYRVSDGLLMGETTTTTGGAFSMTWYDNTEDFRAVCQESATHVGCSAAGIPT